MRIMIRYRWLVTCFVLLGCLLLFPLQAEASRTITSVELNRNVGGTVTVDPSELIEIDIFVSTSWWWGGDDDWRSTGWRIGNLSDCVNHDNHNTTGNYDESFNLPAPDNDGIYSVEFIAYSNNTCSSGASDPSVRTIEVVSAYPSVQTMNLTSFDPTSPDTIVEWTLDFSEVVSGVDVDDFALVEAGGVADSSLIAVSGGGTRWTVTADTGTADTGTLGIDLIDNDTIVNAANVPLGGAGTGNGNFSGPVYRLQPPVLTLSKIVSTSAAAVGDVVTFAISVRNPFSYALDDIVVTDLLPAGMTYVTHVSPAGNVSVSGQTVSWTLPTLGAADSAQMTLAVSLDQQGTFINSVTSPDAIPASATVLALASAVTHFRMDGPIGSWTGAAGEAIDSGGTALHGRRITSTPPTTTNIVDPSPRINSQHADVVGSFCNASSYDGHAVLQVADSPLFDYTTQLSASAWIYPTSYPSDLSSILSNDVNYEFHLNPSGQLYWWWQASTLTSNSVIPLNQWTHIAITLDSSASVRRQRIYINGVLDSNTNNWQGTLATNNCNFHIGGDVETGSCDVIDARNFRGMIDEVKLYGFELNAQEVLADMTLGRSCSGSFDHIRIEHDGYASICAPERVTIKACMDSTCSALYPGNVTVNLTPSGWIDGETFSFSGGIVSRQLSRGIPGDVTLGTNSVSPVPAESTRCYNGSTRSCNLNFADVSCAFDVVESGAVPQTPIFTKLSGVPFNVDILALLDSTTINSNYVNSVNVDLVDARSSACPSGGGLTNATTLAFSLADAGRKMVSFTYPDAARNVKVRVQTGVSAPACSNDNFAIRPQSLEISSADALNTTMTGSPRFAAGDDFNLTVVGLSGYDGLPVINSALVSGSPSAGQLAGTFPAANATSGRSSGDRFTYSEVGHFGLEQHAVYDDSFTAVDQPGDCLPGFSNQLSGGRYGCSFGSQAVPLTIGTSGFGRFVPAYFDITTNNPVLDDGCSGFTYLGQPFGYLINPQLTFIARNRAGGVTSNYGDQYWQMTSTLSERSYENNSVTAASPTISTIGTSLWSDTDNTDGDGIVLISGEVLTYNKPATPAAPFDTNVNLVFSAADLTDSDGVCYDPDQDGSCDGLTLSAITGGEQRHGRLLLQNSYGPETLALNLPLQAEYYDGTAFVPNTLDQCTPYAALNLQLSNYQGHLIDGDTLASGSGSLLSGRGNNLNLSAPGVGHDGSIDVTLDLSQSSGAGLEWLQQGGNNPSARATFGIFEGNPRLIYMRESVW